MTSNGNCSADIKVRTAVAIKVISDIVTMFVPVTSRFAGSSSCKQFSSLSRSMKNRFVSHSRLSVREGAVTSGLGRSPLLVPKMSFIARF